MTKLTNKRYEQQLERRLAKLEKRANIDVKKVGNYKKRLVALEKYFKNLESKLEK